MKIIESKVELLEQEDFYKQIELAGRTCYKSEDKITDASAVEFVKKMIKNGHTAMLEHGTVYLMKSINVWPQISFNRYYRNPYSKVITKNDIIYVTTNFRVLQENNWLDDLQFLCEPTEFHEKRLSVKVVTSRGISHELVRHRSMSFIQESQRYVGYDKDKYDGEVTYIIPDWLEQDLNQYPYDRIYVYHRTYNLDGSVKKTNFKFTDDKEAFIDSLCRSEHYYMSLISLGHKPQEARDVLPNATKTTLVITAFESDWREWFAQRLFGKTGTPHPDMLVLANLIKQEFEKAGVWEGIIKYQSKYD